MTTPQEPTDPFSAPPAPAGAVPPPPGFSDAPAQHSYPYPVLGAAGPIKVPSALATWTIVLTGLYTLTVLISALTSGADAKALNDYAQNPDTTPSISGSTIISFLAFPVVVASYVVLALWMSTLRRNRKARGIKVEGPGAVEWWGWFVPLASLVLPFLGMRALTKGRVGLGLLLGWWLPYVAVGFVGVVSAAQQFGNTDWSTGKPVDGASYDYLVPLSWASALLLIASWVFLALIVRLGTKAEVEN